MKNYLEIMKIDYGVELVLINIPTKFHHFPMNTDIIIDFSILVKFLSFRSFLLFFFNILFQNNHQHYILNIWPMKLIDWMKFYEVLG